MPAVQEGDKILVTGASGYLAVHVVKILLEQGFSVRGTVRSPAKGDYLANLFKDSSASFEYVIVEDIAQPGAFDEAVKGVGGVAHVASPYHFKADNPKELFEPAVNGTIGVLKSLEANASAAKRVVITSSTAAVMDDRIKGPYTQTENDWNPTSVALCEAEGSNAPGSAKYRASKTLAEKALWSFFEQSKVSFDAVAILPPRLYGPLLQQVGKVEDLNTSVAGFRSWSTEEKTQADLPATGMNYVDVRDAALAHVRALTFEQAGGERFICSAGPVSGNDYCVAHNTFDASLSGPKGDAGARESINAAAIIFDGSKAAKVLGIQYRPIEETMRDMCQSLRDRNFL